MDNINLPEFLLLFGCISIDDCWLGTDCIIDESGIKAKHSDWDTINQATYLQKLRIDFPCTARQLFAWAQSLDTWEMNNITQQNHVIKKLPTEFISKWRPICEALYKWTWDAETMRGDVKKKIGTIPFDVTWSHWLALPAWDKKQSALLLFGICPNKFYQIENHTDYQSMCVPLVEFMQILPDNLTSPLSWLSWFDKQGYLDYGATPLRNWFKGQAETVRNDAEPNREKTTTNPKTTSKRIRKLNDWLRIKWDEWGKPNAKDFAARLKPLQGTFGSPVKKYHFWCPSPGVVVEWADDWGSKHWSIRAFQNKVTNFRKDDKLASENSCQ